jgi:hypothetical protein
VPSVSRREMSAAELRQEMATARRVLASSPSPHLQLDRVLMANSGTLLITWLDTSGWLRHLRQQLHRAFPGACTSQATIVHTSLFRVLTPQQLPRDTISAISQECDRLTAQLRGTTWQPSRVWYVNEREFSTIIGDKHVMELRGEGEAGS